MSEPSDVGGALTVVSIRVKCHSCGKLLKAPVEYVGRVEKCPACGASVTIPSATETAAHLSPPLSEWGPLPSTSSVDFQARPKNSGSRLGWLAAAVAATITFVVIGATGWMLHRSEIEKANATITSLKKEYQKASQAEAEMREEVASIHAKERAQREREILEVQKRDEFARIKAQQDSVRGSLTKGWSGKVDGGSFSYENLNWRLEDSGMKLTGEIRNESKEDWYTAAFQITLYDDSNQPSGMAWFYMTNLNAGSTASFTADVYDFKNNPDEIHVRVHFQGGGSAQQVDPAFHRFTNDSGSLDIEAKIVDVQDNLVWLEKLNRQRIKVKRDLLSAGSKDFVQKWVAENQISNAIRPNVATANASIPARPSSFKDAGAGHSDDPLFHRWRSGNGTLDIDAKIVDYRDGVVTLQRPDGGQVQVKLDFLSATSKGFVRQWIAENKK